jgi:hypothetical protein
MRQNARIRAHRQSACRQWHEGLTRPGPAQDYHFAPCVACISLWSGKRFESPAFGAAKKPPPPPAEPPRSPTSKDAAQTEQPPEDEKPKRQEVEDKYNTEGGCRLILGSREGGVRIFESSTRVSARVPAVPYERANDE